MKPQQTFETSGILLVEEYLYDFSGLLLKSLNKRPFSEGSSDEGESSLDDVQLKLPGLVEEEEPLDLGRHDHLGGVPSGIVQNDSI